MFDNRNKLFPYHPIRQNDCILNEFIDENNTQIQSDQLGGASLDKLQSARRYKVFPDIFNSMNFFDRQKVKDNKMNLNLPISELQMQVLTKSFGPPKRKTSRKNQNIVTIKQLGQSLEHNHSIVAPIMDKPKSEGKTEEVKLLKPIA